MCLHNAVYTVQPIFTVYNVTVTHVQPIFTVHYDRPTPKLCVCVCAMCGWIHHASGQSHQLTNINYD